jgi:gliding motility-associated-like protein
MKKITLLLITLLFSFTAFSQALLQGFETPSTPFGIPANWARFQSGSGSESWFTDGTTPRSGTKHAMLFGENLGVGNSAKYYLASPVVTIPLNGQLRFWVKTSQQGDQGGVFKIKIASAALPANQTSEAAYTTTLQTYSESQLSTNVAPAPIVYEEQVVDFPPATFPAGTQVYIAFVSEINQTSPFQGDDLFLDDVLVVSRCLEPTTLGAGTFTSSSAVLNWTNPNPLTGVGLNTCNQWEIEIIPATQLNPIGSGIIVNTNPYTATTLTVAPFAPLLPLTQYKYYVRSLCAFSGSIWAGPFPFTTAPGPAVCGGNYVDIGGISGTYANNTTAATGTTTICPVTPGDAVTVTFTSFATEATLDVLRVYNGNSSAGTLLGTFSGNLTGVNLPGPFTSTDPNGCLTFVFTSDNTVTAAGWLSNITCAPIPTCTRPNTLTSSAITTTSVTVGFTQPANPSGSTATAWQYIALPCGTAAPTATSTGWTRVTSNPFVASGLTPGLCYDIYVRAECSATDVSFWSLLPVSVTTVPGCGGSFYDLGGPNGLYPNNVTAATGTTTICPSIPGQVVTVTFNSFATQNGLDLLRVYDGDVATGTLLGTFSGTATIGPFTATNPSGCLTFVFTSNATTNAAGWNASVTCGPPPTCTKPKTLTATTITQSTALLGWTQPANPDGSFATAWQVAAIPCGSAVPPIGSPLWLNANSNPFYITGLTSATCYDYYVRAICSPTDASSIAGPFSFNTLIANDECTGAIDIAVNQNTNCLQTVLGSVAFATGSIQANSCGGTIDDDDVWFKFTATATSHYITILGENYTTAPGNINFALYTGTCGALTQFGTTCFTVNNNTATGLTIGQTYYIRAYSTGTTASTTRFELCVGTNVGTCGTALPLCAINPIIIPNNVGVPTLPNPISPFSTTSTTVGCLGSAPSPTFYYLQIPTNGNYNFFLEQNTSSAFNGTGIDVDFVAWGPFASNAAACAGISTTNAPATGIGCSFSAAFTENFGVNNAIAGEIYIIMITNFNGRKGFVRITQTAGPIPTICCPFGNFTYPKNFFCQNEANPSPSFVSNATAGTFSAVPAGLAINPVTGLINLAGSTPGSYVVYNTIGASGTCPSDVDSWAITITVPPSNVNINYSAPSYCKTDTTVQNVTQTGTTGGNYTVSPAVGLSINTVTGAITPSTSTVGTYVVSYNLPQFLGCPGAVSTTTVNIVLPVPTFNPAPPICAGGTSAPLPTTSLEGITGTWSPAINNTATTIYTFTPNAGQCATTTTMTIQVGTVAPLFTQVAPICVGATLAALPTTSTNGVVGTWTPAINNNATTTYTFSPSSGTCSSTATMTITVNPATITPSFLDVTPICNGGTLLPLPTTSQNGVIGTWAPALNNLATTTYTFTPTSGQCSLPATKSIIVNPVLGVTVNSPTVCSGTSAIVTATPTLPGNYSYAWTVPTGATNPGNVPTFTATVSGAYSVVITQQNNFCNSDFESNLNIPLGNMLLVNQNNFQCWRTTATDGIIEVWTNGTENTNAYSGTQFIELNANQVSTLFQNISVIPGSSVNVSFAHRGRFSGTDVMRVEIGPFGGPYVSLGNFTATPSAWVFNSVNYTFPNNGVTNYTIRFVSVSSGSGNLTVGNFIDAVSITGLGCSSSPVTGNVLITGVRTPTFTQIPTLCQNSVAPLLPTTSTNTPAITGTWNSTISTANIGATTYTFTPAPNQCANPTTMSISVAASPVATFNYNSTTYCKTGANPVITYLNGGGAGVFTSTAGLSLNSSTGAIDLSTSTPGNYIITNTIAATTSCPIATATFAITITAAPIATFSYAGTPYCISGSNPTPTFTGSGVAGTFTSTAGLIINSSTGVINLATSTPGNYTVTNTIAAANGCAQVQSTAQVTITAVPVATFSYNSAIYCKTGANPVITLNGSAGVFTSTSGLSLNSSTGAIDLSLSTAGNYTITNTIAAAGGCSSVTATFAITITAPQVATFSYPGSPYCKTATNPNPVFSGGGVAGTFTSTTGLSINATTGAINLSTSVAGNYTVTNTIAASAGCPAIVSTTQVTITNLPQATIAYSDAFYCYDNTGSQAVTITGTTGGTFSASPSGLSISATSGAFNVSNSPAGPYTVTYTMPAAGGCPQATATTTFTIIPQIDVQLTAVCVGPDFTITALPVAGSFNPANATYEWSGPNGYTFGPTSNPSIVISIPGTYTSTVTVNGCRYVNTQQVDGITCTIQKGISPNGDGDNEAFILSDVKALSIFNRYGTKVYSHGENYTNQWRGQTDSGSELPDGTYYYVITRNSGNTFTGWIYINR